MTSSPSTSTPPREPFVDRRDAGRALAQALQRWAGDPGLLVLGLPRGGVPVAFEVARALQAQLDVCVVRKLGVPGQEELAMGALASGGAEVLDTALIERLGLKADQVDRVRAREAEELARREALYRGQRPPPRLTGQTLIVVDDGIATGASLRAALSALRTQGPARLIAAAPVGAPQACRQLQALCDEVLCLWRPPDFGAVGHHYANFDATPDGEVIRLLDEARAWAQPTGTP